MPLFHYSKCYSLCQSVSTREASCLSIPKDKYILAKAKPAGHSHLAEHRAASSERDLFDEGCVRGAFWPRAFCKGTLSCQAESTAAMPGISPTFLTPKQRFFPLETEAETVWWEGKENPDGEEIKIFLSEVPFPPFTR